MKITLTYGVQGILGIYLVVFAAMFIDPIDVCLLVALFGGCVTARALGILQREYDDLRT